jgi:predicted dehydrogenase
MNLKSPPKYNIGIVGTNFGLKTVAPAILRSNAFNLVCLADTSSRIPIDNSLESKIIKTDLDSLLIDPKIDIVWIATPSVTHFELVERALLSGKKVVCEKPAGRTSQETKGLSLLSRNLSLPIFVDFEFRYDPIYTNIFEIASQIPKNQNFKIVITWKTLAKTLNHHGVDPRPIFLDFGIHVLDCLLDFGKRIDSLLVEANEVIGICSVCQASSQNCLLVNLFFARFSASIIICRNYDGLGTHQIDLLNQGSLTCSGITQPYSSNDLFFYQVQEESPKMYRDNHHKVDSYFSDMREYSIGLLLLDIENFLSHDKADGVPPSIEDAVRVREVIDSIVRTGTN